MDTEQSREELKRKRQLEANRRYYERNRQLVIEKVRLNQLQKKIEKLEAELKALPDNIY